MPYMNEDTCRQRERIRSLVQTFLARSIQVSTIVNGTASSWRMDAFTNGGFTHAEKSDMQDWKVTMAIVLGRVDRDIARGAWRATAHRLICEMTWAEIAAGLNVSSIREAKAIVLRATARIYAEVEARNIPEHWAAKAA